MQSHSELFENETFLFDPISHRTLLAATEPPQGLPNNAGDDGDEEDNHHFWRTLKEHYIGEPDDDLLVAIVENGLFNEQLRLTAGEQVRAALLKHVIALLKLQKPIAHASKPPEPDASYIGPVHILCNSRMHNHFIRGVADLAVAAMQIAKQEQDADKATAGHAVAEVAEVQIKELLDDPVPFDAAFLEAENDDRNDELDDEIVVSDIT